MQTFDQSLYSLYKAGLITLEEALQARHATPTSSSSRSRASSPPRTWRAEEMDAALEAPDDFNPLQEESPFDFSNQPPGRG